MIIIITDSELFNMDMSLLIVKDGKNLLLKGLTENKIKNVNIYFYTAIKLFIPNQMY